MNHDSNWLWRMRLGKKEHGAFLRLEDGLKTPKKQGNMRDAGRGPFSMTGLADDR